MSWNFEEIQNYNNLFSKPQSTKEYLVGGVLKIMKETGRSMKLVYPLHPLFHPKT